MAWSEWLSSNIYFQIFMKQTYLDWKDHGQEFKWPSCTLKMLQNISKSAIDTWKKNNVMKLFTCKKKISMKPNEARMISQKNLSIVLLQGQCLQTLQGPLHAFQKNIVHIVGRRIARGNLPPQRKWISGCHWLIAAISPDGQQFQVEKTH